MLGSYKDTYTVILPSEESTSNIYYYVRAYDQSGLSSRYPTTGFYKFEVKNSKSTTISKNACKIKLNGFFEMDFPDKALLKNMDAAMYVLKTVQATKIDDCYIKPSSGEELKYSSMETYNYGEYKSLNPYSKLLYNDHYITLNDVNDYSYFVEINSMIDGKYRSIILNLPVEIYYTIKTPKGFTDYSNLEVMYYDYLDNLWFPLQTEVATIVSQSANFNYVKLKSTTNHLSLFGIFEKTSNSKGDGSASRPDLIDGVVVSKNPFVAHLDQQTSIGFNVNQSNVKIEFVIYDVSGRIVYEYENTYSGPASVALPWNGAGRFNQPLPSGTYIAVIKATSESGKQVIVKKVIMMVK